MAKSPKNKIKPKQKISITIEYELYQWLEEQVKSKRFGSKSHGVEVALKRLKNKIERGEPIIYE